MSCLETPDFCSLREYQRGQENRLQAYDLRVDEIYLLLAALKVQTVGRAAVKLPAKVHDVQETDSGLYRVQFSMLDDDLQPDVAADERFVDGYWIDPRHEELDNIKTGYFKKYKNPIDDEWQRVGDSLELVSTSISGTLGEGSVDPYVPGITISTPSSL